MNKNIACIILAAGKGERMKSAMPKVLHNLCGRPMLNFVLDLVRDLKIKQAVVVVGHKQEEVKKLIHPSGIKTVVQKKLQGTADAVKVALAQLKNFKGHILVLYGDMPLLKKETINALIKYHLKSGPDATLLTASVDKPQGYGRILRDKYAGICGIVEEKDADDFQKELKEINSGIIIFKKERLEAALKDVRANNRKREYYLTATVGILYKKGFLLDSLRVTDAREAIGINSRVELALADKILRKRINERIMQSGVTLIDPASTFINYGVKIGQDTTIYPFTVIENHVTIGKSCLIGPFVHLREGTRLKNNTLNGNIVEIVRSSIGSKTWVKHFSYLGDALIGEAVNIGAGSVIANFDGTKKNTTVIKDGAFIGSDTVLVAPVKVGKNAVTAAGSVVLKNHNVADGMLVAGVPAKVLKKAR